MNGLRRAIAVALLLTLGLAGVASAADIYWQGANTNSLNTYAETYWLDYDSGNDWWTWKTGYDETIVDQAAVAATLNVDGQDLWDTGVVPGAGDTAYFDWSTDRRNLANLEDGSYAVEQDVIINGSFNPDYIVHNSANWQSPTNEIRIQKNLSIIALDYNSGYTTATKGQIIIDDGYTLTLTGSDPFTFDGYQGDWKGLVNGAGSTVEFTGDTINLNSYNDIDGDRYGGGVGGTGTLAFSNSASTINLGDPNNVNPDRRQGTIKVGDNALYIDSRQTWSNASGLGYIDISTEAAADGSSVLNHLAGDTSTRFDNLGAVGLRFDAGGSDSKTLLLSGGTYGSLCLYSYLHWSNRIAQYQMQDDIELTSGFTEIVNDTNVVGDYSIYFDPGSRYSGSTVVLNGHTLEMAKGIYMQKTQTDSTPLAGANTVDATGAGSVLIIGGDWIIRDALYAGYNDGSEFIEGRRLGIRADANSVITLGGNFSSNARSLDASLGNDLYLATLNLVGGTSGDANTFEIGADKDDDFVAGTFAIDTLNIGTAGQTAYIQLVNEYLNDGDSDFTDPATQTKSKDNEILLAATLGIADGSTLDLNGLTVRISSDTLLLPSGATLDLNTGLVLAADDVVASFIGMGDQASEWNALGGSVIDSSNPALDFTAVYNAGDDATYWQAVPEPTTLGLMALGAAALIRRRRK